MLSIPGTTRIFLYQDKVDMRKSFEGLSALAEENFPDQLLTGALFIFLNKKKDRIKVLYFDQDGLAIWYKLLEKGTFSWKQIDHTSINRREFLILLEGITPKRLQKRWQPP